MRTCDWWSAILGHKGVAICTQRHGIARSLGQAIASSLQLTLWPFKDVDDISNLLHLAGDELAMSVMTCLWKRRNSKQCCSLHATA